MGKPPLFWQRWGQSAHRPADLGGCGSIEPLEQRVLLAASVTAANVFAQFEGTINTNLGKSAGQSGYSPGADANLNGVIDAFDVAQAGANLKDKTSLKVLALSVAPGAAHPLPDGSFAVASSPLTLAGATMGRFT